MNLSRIILPFFGIFLLFNITSCGSSNTITVTLLPSIGFHPKKFHQLTEEFFQQGSSSTFTNVLNSSNSCRQMNVRTAMAVGPEAGNGNVSTFVVSNMRTAMPSPSPFTTSWLNTAGNVEFETPLKIDISKGVNAEVGFFAILNLPGDQNSDGVCDNIVGGVAQPSYVLFGHKLIGSPTTSITVPLNIFMLNTTPNPTPVPPTYALGSVVANSPTPGVSGGYTCSNSSDFNLCPVKDIVEIKMTPPASGVQCKIGRIRYFSGANGTAPLDNLINDYSASPSTASYFFVTHSDTYEITLYNTSTFTEATIISDDNAIFNTTTNPNLAGICDASQSIKVGPIGTL